MAKIIAINGSPRTSGNTATMLNLILKKLEAAGHSAEILHIGNKKISGCIACYKCVENKNKKCAIDDDMINECIEKLSGADCMQSTPFSFRYEPIFLQKMGYKRTSSQGIRPDVEMLGADTAIEAKSIHDGVLQNFYDSIFCASPCPSFCWRSFPCHDSLC